MRSKQNAESKSKKAISKADKNPVETAPPKDSSDVRNGKLLTNKSIFFLVVLVLVIVLSLALFHILTSKDQDTGPEHICPDCNVLLISIDTLRADHVGSYGYEYNTTPFIDELAERGMLFEAAITSVPLTLPSHTSILTSLHPFQHGVRDNGRYSVGESVVTLPELLKDSGFVTAAFVSSYVLDSSFGLDQGFDVYNDELTHPQNRTWKDKWFNITNISKYERKADEVSDAYLKWLSNNSDGQFFAWIHYFDPHQSYRPPAKYRRMFKSEHKYYDGEIRFTDDQIRRVLTGMEELGLLDNTLVVVVADHGEGLWDHGERIHGKFLYDTTTRIPLVVVNPRQEGGLRFKGVVETIDIAPTILEILGLDKPQDMQGESLYDLIDAGGKQMAYLETYYRTRGRRKQADYSLGFRTGELKYIFNNITGDDLYNLTLDPGENNNIIKRGRKSAYYKEILDDFVAGASSNVHQSNVMELDEESEEKLKSLGYMI